LWFDFSITASGLEGGRRKLFSPIALGAFPVFFVFVWFGEVLEDVHS
jgi:hypothetical protein